MAIGTDEQWRRLQGLYAAMSDGELLKLVRGKAGLTEVAQQAVDAELAARGLVVAAEEDAPQVEEMPELSTAQGDPSLVELMTFQIAMDAETALRELDGRGIPVRIEPAIRQLEEGGPLVQTNWLTIFVERARQQEAVLVLRERMGLFPVLASDEVDNHDDGEEGALVTVATFDVAADAEVAGKALTEAGIWFQLETDGEEEGTSIEVHVRDMERALEVVEAAFSEEAAEEEEVGEE